MPDRHSSGVSGHVLLVDDEPAVAEALERLLVSYGYVVATARDGEEGLETLKAGRFDLVLSDVRMPNCDGFEMCRRIKRDPLTRLTPVVLMTGASEAEDRIRAIETGADDFLRKPVDPQELRARVRSLVRLKRHTDDLESAENLMLSLAMAVEARDHYTHGHCERLAEYATTLGRHLGLPMEDIEALRRGGYLHDLGKIAIPDAILLKRGPLSPDEFEVMRQHPVVGDRLCSPLHSLDRVRPIIRHHHERLDGTGYPDGIRGDQIPLLAQILAVADIYDAVRTERPYKPPRSVSDACAVLGQEVDRGWRRRDLVEPFIALALDGELDRAIVGIIPKSSTSR
jgi:putative two-component system response regulator